MTVVPRWCLYCGCEFSQLVDYSYVDIEGPYQYECTGCLARGPIGHTPEEAAEKWNLKVAPEKSERDEPMAYHGTSLRIR